MEEETGWGSRREEGRETLPSPKQMKYTIRIFEGKVHEGGISNHKTDISWSGQEGGINKRLEKAEKEGRGRGLVKNRVKK